MTVICADHYQTPAAPREQDFAASRAGRSVSRATQDACVMSLSAVRTRFTRPYGIKRRFNGRDGEVDHLVSLELGGSNSTANLFPEAASPVPGSHEKDRLENELH